MKSFFQKYEIGGKLILLSALFAFLSFFFNWLQFYTMVGNGFKQGAYILLIVFIYPVAIILLQKQIKKRIAYLNAVIGILLGISYISMYIVDDEGVLYKAYGYGPIIFILSCGMLAIGIWKYRVKDMNRNIKKDGRMLQ